MLAVHAAGGRSHKHREPGDAAKTSGLPRRKDPLHLANTLVTGGVLPPLALQDREPEGSHRLVVCGHHAFRCFDERPECTRHVREVWRQSLEKSLIYIQSPERPRSQYSCRVSRASSTSFTLSRQGVHHDFVYPQAIRLIETRPGGR
jgi:hypothetical protein